MIYDLSNPSLAIKVDEHGAELKSLVRLSDRCEMLWQADPVYWDGQSPILFPTVGSSYGHAIRHQGKAYPMPKHGLVKDMAFALTDKTAESLTLSLESNEETLAHYPFDFRLSVSYTLKGTMLGVIFSVQNRSGEPMPFLLGAHPALNLPRFNEADAIHGYLGFGEIKDRLVSIGLKPGGYAWHEGSFDVHLNEEGLLPLTNETFECDTILDDTSRVCACTLFDKEKKPVACFRFSSPVLALWAPCGGKAPFVCIEPWWGLCDEAGYHGEFIRRPFVNIVPKGETQEIRYTIELP